MGICSYVIKSLKSCLFKRSQVQHDAMLMSTINTNPNINIISHMTDSDMDTNLKKSKLLISSHNLTAVEMNLDNTDRELNLTFDQT